MTNNAKINKDLANRTITVAKEFNAPVEKTWRAWTEAEILDKWWAPKPWKAVTKTLDFTNGGYWLYAMTGPNGEIVWSRVGFTSIVPQQSFKTDVAFCDENGVRNDGVTSRWLIEFHSAEAGTQIIVTIQFDTDADMEQLVAMGFEGGFTMGLNNLDELLDSLAFAQ